MPQTLRYCKIFKNVKSFMNQLVLEQKTLSNLNSILDSVLINDEVKILMKEITWEDVRGLSCILEEDEG